jgi:hypothetical protein
VVEKCDLIVDLTCGIIGEFSPSQSLTLRSTNLDEIGDFVGFITGLSHFFIISRDLNCIRLG